MCIEQIEVIGIVGRHFIFVYYEDIYALARIDNFKGAAVFNFVISTKEWFRNNTYSFTQSVLIRKTKYLSVLW